ncbi:MAG: glycerol-3-phosphate 1-O-acyltransferase PlsY [Phycisphaerales bacterium]|nr:glycerol-3-phosphate 1-O-acyltransferase PlsY [Phycisphaerae bacterium]NNF42947.1 glycerol-3-phosphate 1-O-acyltransferase PlsY [Phycisphaerales bacterium]NNM27749.1 glycerol-3-phosphate 1-O-acyltransferase PlsY [Phycisphaerales bacterium]
MTVWIISIIAAYFVGSIPFGVILGRLRGVDVRAHGSRNIGATNVGRVLGRPWGITCFLLDMLKGATPVVGAGLAAGVFGREPDPATGTAAWMWWWMAVAAAAIAGHMASPFLGFAGGKGVATSFGAMLAMWPLLSMPALGAVCIWYAALRLFRVVSLASMLAAVSLPLWYAVRMIPNTGDDVGAKLLYASPPLIATTLLAALVIWRHRANIGRLRRGEEPRIANRSTPEAGK